MEASASNLIRSLRKAWGAVLLAVGLVATQLPIAFAATTVDSVEGSAYGAYASVDLLLVDGSLGPVPSVSLAADGGDVADNQASTGLTLGLTEVVDLGTLEVGSTGSGVGGSEGEVSSLATVDDVEILGALIEAGQVTASCSADSSGAEGEVTLTGASATGLGALSVSPSPNSALTVPGVGDLTLNKQTTGADGTLTVTAMSLILLPVAGTGTIEIAEVTCGVETSTSSAPTTTTSTPPTNGGPTTTEPGSSTSTSVSGSGPTTTLPGPSTTAAPDGPASTAAPDGAIDFGDDPMDAGGDPMDRGGDPIDAGAGASKTRSSAAKAAGDAVPYDFASRDPSTGTDSEEVAENIPSSAEATSDSGATSSPWLTLVDYAILTLLGGSAALIGWTKLDIRRLVRAPWLTRRGP